MLSGRHITFLSGSLVSIAAIGSAFHDWHEMMQPAFVFGVLGIVGTHLGAAFTDKEQP